MTILHILDQNEVLVETLENKPGFDAVYWDDMHHRALKNNVDTYEFTTVDTAKNRAAQYLVGKNKLVVTDHRGNQFLFIIEHSERINENGQRVRRVEAYGDHYRLRTAGVIEPTRLQGATLKTAGQYVLDGTEWQVGIAEYSGIRTVTFDEYTNPLKALHHIASTFEVELRFRVEFDGNRIVGKYVDFLQPIEIFDGKEIVYRKDMVGIRRIETTDEIYTTMVGVGPADEDGNFLTFESVNDGKNYIEDSDAVQRWGRHWYVYSPETEDQDMTPQRLKSLTEIALKKHIESVVKYEVRALALDRIPGFEHENIELGYYVRMKDEEFNPALYLTARVIEEKRSYTDPTRDEFLFGNYVEHELTRDHLVTNIQKLLFRKTGRWDANTRTIRSATPPSDTTALWIDTSQTPNVPKTWDGNAWVKASPTQAGEIGAETPAGAQQKADQAEQNAKNYAEQRVQEAEQEIEAAKQRLDEAENRITQAEQDIVQAEIRLDELDQELSSLDMQKISEGIFAIEGGSLYLEGTLYTRSGGVFDGDIIARNMTLAGNITAQNAVITGTITGSDAIFKQITVEDAVIKNVSVQNATITGTLAGVDGTFVGTLIGNQIDGATITGGLIRTAESGARLEIGQTDKNRIRFFDSNGFFRGAIGFADDFGNQLALGGVAGVAIQDIYGDPANLSALNISAARVDALDGDLFLGDYTTGTVRVQRPLIVQGYGEIRYDQDRYFRIRSNAGSHENSIVFDRENNSVSIYQNGAFRHAFRPDGTKIGGSVEHENKVYGMSPVDSPQVVLSSFIFHQDIDGEKVFELDDVFSAVISDYDVISTNPEIRTEKIDERSFKAVGHGKTSFIIFGLRKGYEEVYWMSIAEVNRDEGGNEIEH